MFRAATAFWSIVVTPQDSQRISLPVKLGYGGGLFGVSLAQLGVSTLLMYFYTDLMNFTPASAGLLMLIGGITDCFANILAATAATYPWSRLGRYRPFLIYGAAPLGVSFALLFMKPDLPAGALFAFAAVVHILYRAAYAFIAVPHAGLITRISADANERASIGGIKAAAGGLGALGAGYLGIGLIAWLGGKSEQLGFVWFGAIMGTFITASVFVSGAVTKETVTGSTLDADSTSLAAALRYAVRNRALVSILVANILFFIGYAFLFGGAAYFFKYLYLDPGSTKSAVLASAIGAIIFPTLWVAIARRYSKRITWLAGSALITAAFLILYGAPAAPLWLILALYVCLGAGKASVLMNYYSMTADAVDYGQWKLGRRVEAYSFGFLSLSSKLGLALGGGLMGFALSWAGFEANVAQHADTLERLRIAIFIVPAAVCAGSGLAISFFAVDNAKHRRIMADLAAGQTAAAT